MLRILKKLKGNFKADTPIIFKYINIFSNSLIGTLTALNFYNNQWNDYKTIFIIILSITSIVSMFFKNNSDETK